MKEIIIFFRLEHWVMVVNAFCAMAQASHSFLYIYPIYTRY